MGKTRLAVQAAEELGPHFADGVVFVALAPLNAPEHVATTIAAACGCPLTPTRSADDTLLDYLRSRELLLVLDNMEHLLPATSLVAAILREAPAVKLLVTSRERLRLHGEHSFELGSLALPRDDTRDAIERSEAVLLFVERARQVVHDFVLTPDNRGTVAHICRQLDGMPLAIELAAAWSHALTPEEIAAELSRGLGLLQSSDRDGDVRHRSMRTVLDHSWVLLPREERCTLARLSVFRGGCDREAATVVTGASLPTLGALLDKSLLQRAQRSGTTRYTLHELVRQYAAERLAEDAADQAATETHHAAYYTDLLQHAINAHTGGAAPDAWTHVIQEIDNLRTAWLCAATNGDTGALLAMARGLMLLYDHQGWVRDGVALFGHAAEALRLRETSTDAARGVALGYQSYFLQRTGRPTVGAELLEQGLALMQAAGAVSESVDLLLYLGSAEGYAARLPEARAYYLQAARLAEATGDEFIRLWATFFLGREAMNAGNFADAEQYLTTCVAAWRDQGFNRGLAAALVFLGETLRLSGHLTVAEAAVREGLQVGANHRDELVIALGKRELGALALAHGDLVQAHALLGDSCARLRERGDTAAYIRSRPLLVQLEVRHGLLAAARQGCVELLQAVRANFMMALPDAAYALTLLLTAEGSHQEALAVLIALHDTPGEYETRQRAAQLRAELEGRLNPVQRAAAIEQARAPDLLPWLEAICARPPTSTTTEVAPPRDARPIVSVGGLLIAETGETLSPREVEVLHLIAAGANNAAIAQQLVISLHTVKTHVAHILAKLDVTSRTEAALRARELGIH
jgi:predicted ATPase/DNA-binding CsgD family transcriptional regulator